MAQVHGVEDTTSPQPSRNERERQSENAIGPAALQPQSSEAGGRPQFFNTGTLTLAVLEFANFFES